MRIKDKKMFVRTFGAFVLMGFSINTLTMFAMILAIGLVVDDAIVVVEAVEHHVKRDPPLGRIC